MAILNQRDYRLAKARLAQLQEARGARVRIEESVSGLSSDIAEARRLSLKAEEQRLIEEVRVYESLRSNVAKPHQAIDSSDLGMLPILARIARGWSQKQLADFLGLKEQQIQRYENDRYAGISLARYERLLELMSIELSAKLSDLTGIETNKLQPELELSSSVIREITARSWIPNDTASREDVVEAVQAYVRSGLKLSKSRAFNRQTLRHAPNLDGSALLGWRARVLQTAYSISAGAKGKFNLADIGWVRKLVQLSPLKDGPIQALEFLRDKGIVVVTEAHLPHTHLDGAAFLLSTGVPVIGMTLRHDRLDHFWFTLLHEIGHVILHFNHGLDAGFIDDFEIDARDFELEADTFARTSLISDEVWKSAPVRFSKSPDMVKSFAEQQGIHVAIVAGRLRQERKDYSKLSDLVGQGEVRRMLTQYRT